MIRVFLFSLYSYGGSWVVSSSFLSVNLEENKKRVFVLVVVSRKVSKLKWGKWETMCGFFTSFTFTAKSHSLFFCISFRVCFVLLSAFEPFY